MDQRWLVGGVLAARRPPPRNSGETDPPSHRALNLFWRSFPNRAIFRILHRWHVSTGADGFNLLVSRNQWRFPLISLW